MSLSAQWLEYGGLVLKGGKLVWEVEGHCGGNRGGLLWEVLEVQLGRWQGQGGVAWDAEGSSGGAAQVDGGRDDDNEEQEKNVVKVSIAKRRDESYSHYVRRNTPWWLLRSRSLLQRELRTVPNDSPLVARHIYHPFHRIEVFDLQPRVPSCL